MSDGNKTAAEIAALNLAANAAAGTPLGLADLAPLLAAGGEAANPQTQLALALLQAALNVHAAIVAGKGADWAAMQAELGPALAAYDAAKGPLA